MIYVTDYMLARHAEVLQAYERLGKEDLARRARLRFDRLAEMQSRQAGKFYKQTTLKL